MRAVRIALVTLGLSAAGALLGAVAAAIVVAAWLTATDGLSWLAEPGILLFGGAYGAILGPVLAPLGAWLLMRHVPLGLAVAGTLLGTVTGGVAGVLLTNDPFISMVMGMAGFAAAAVRLRRRVPRDRRLARG